MDNECYKIDRRYVCPKCIKTFIDKDYNLNKICWNCGEVLEVFTKDPELLEINNFEFEMD